MLSVKGPVLLGPEYRLKRRETQVALGFPQPAGILELRRKQRDGH